MAVFRYGSMVYFLKHSYSSGCQRVMVQDSYHLGTTSIYIMNFTPQIQINLRKTKRLLMQTWENEVWH